MISLGGEEDPDFLREVRRRAVGRFELTRRGVDHGTLVELRPEGLLPPRPRRRRRAVIAAQRWRAAQPILLPDAVAPGADLGTAEAELYAAAGRPDTLAAWLAARGQSVAEADAARFDPERDLARCQLEARGPGPAPWIKGGRLSLHPEDASRRVRIAFGVEGRDDADPDPAGQRAIGALGVELLPGARRLFAGDLLDQVGAVADAPLAATGPIAYWNAPGGGARFHHDAFAGEEGGGQRGVLFWQGLGRTLWLALSIEELALRLREFLGWLAEGEFPWLRDELGPRFESLVELSAARVDLHRELARPGCGAFGTLVDRPGFTAFLADAGHALVLAPGDVLLLPNHGLGRTALHSVFHASGARAYGLSFALRGDLASGAT